MISTLTIKCVWGAYLKDAFERTLEVPDAMTLGELHDEIQRLTDFDNDHPFTFFIGRSSHRKRQEVVETDDWEARTDALSAMALTQVFPLPKNMKLFYWFDFGDDWMFQITRRGNPKSEEKGIKYPRLVKEVGPKPEQYPPCEE